LALVAPDEGDPVAIVFDQDRCASLRQIGAAAEPLPAASGGGPTYTAALLVGIEDMVAGQFDDVGPASSSNGVARLGAERRAVRSGFGGQSG
jgi:hypothetical protein